MSFLSSFARAAWRASFLTSLTAGAAALAQPTIDAALPMQLSPVVVQGRDTNLLGVVDSASQGIVGAAELAARPLLRRGELLEVVPGVVVTQHSGDGKANQYFLRGFNLDHGTDFALGVDSMPVNLRSHAHGQGYADLNFMIPEMVQQIDYSKGPYHAEVGDFSAAGAANFRQRDAVSRPFVTLSLGENRFARVAAGASQPTSAGTLTGAFEYTHDDGPWRLPEDSSRFNAFVRHHWTRAGADYRLTAMAYRAKWRSTDQVPLRAVVAGALDRLGAIDPTDGGESERASLSFDATLRGSDATTRLHAYAIYYRLNLFSDFTYFLDDPVNGDQFNQRDRRGVLGGAIERTWAHAGGRRSQTIVGAQARVDAIGELGLFRTAARRRLSTVRNDDVDEASLGLFLKNETQWTPWLRTNEGLRLDGYRFKVASDEPRNSGTRLADIASPKLGVAFGPWQKTELYANAGYGFHSNDARGTTIRVDPADGASPVERVTPLARSRGAEIGLRTSAVPGLVTTLSLWALDLDSELVFVGDAGGTEASGRTRRRGVELANFFRITPGFAVDADVALTHARYRDATGAGNHIANSIGTVVTAGITAGGREGWFGSARLRFFGSQPLVEDDSVRAPSSLSCNARVGWRARDWEAAVDVLNALDRRSYDIAYFYASRLRGEPADGVADLHFHPAEPRTFRLSVTRRF